jgi:hypothetical protein
LREGDHARDRFHFLPGLVPAESFERDVRATLDCALTLRGIPCRRRSRNFRDRSVLDNVLHSTGRRATGCSSSQTAVSSKLAWTERVVFKHGRSWHGPRWQLDGTWQYVRDKRLHRDDRLLAASQSTGIAARSDGL